MVNFWNDFGFTHMEKKNIWYTVLKKENLAFITGGTLTRAHATLAP